jgi:hypothetical protein
VTGSGVGTAGDGADGPGLRSGRVAACALPFSLLSAPAIAAAMGATFVVAGALGSDWVAAALRPTDPATAPIAARSEEVVEEAICSRREGKCCACVSAACATVC